MTDNVVFVLDANVFVEAARRYYAFDLAPKFWGSLIQYAESGHIQSIDRVKQELERGQDELAAWAKRDFSQGFASTDEVDVVSCYGDIMTWVQGQNQFSAAAKSDFASGANGWLVAHANVKNYVVVTHEVLNPEIQRKVPIPNVCQEFNVQHVDTFEMLRQLGVRFN